MTESWNNATFHILSHLQPPQAGIRYFEGLIVWYADDIIVVSNIVYHGIDNSDMFYYRDIFISSAAGTA